VWLEHHVSVGEDHGPRELDFADQLLSAMRKQFGGHAEITAASR
jgi:6-phosphogluconate dehydrogenase (decarboxylating)